MSNGAEILAAMADENKRMGQAMADAKVEADFNGSIRQLSADALKSYGKPVVAKNAKDFAKHLTKVFRDGGMSVSQEASVELRKLEIYITIGEVRGDK